MTKRLRVVLVVAILLVGVVAAPAAAQTGHDNTPVYYLSLGTSLAAGVQADPADGQSVVTDVSYTTELADIVDDDISKLRHENLGCPGETSTSLIAGGICDYAHGSQLDEAAKFLEQHGEFVGLITIDVGANDVLACVDGTEIDMECMAATVNQLAVNLDYILTTLQSEAEPDVAIVGMNYYNPFLIYWFVDHDLAYQTAALLAWINGTLEYVYAAHGVPVADVAGAFQSDNFTLLPNGIPVNVALLCQWTWMDEWYNIHANDDGYAVMAQSFAGVLPEIPISMPPRN
jgi:lysophospholipase L1-like esterase